MNKLPTISSRILGHRAKHVFNLSRMRRKPMFYLKAVRLLLARMLFRQELPRGVAFASSYSCNFKCQHCYALIFGRKNSAPLSFHEKIAVLRECVGMGVVSFDFIGGEIGATKEFPELLKHLPVSSLNISLASNGYIMTRDKVREFKQMGVDKISISIDSGDAAEHDLFRNKPGSHQRCMEALNNIRAEGLSPVIITVVARGDTRKPSFRKLVDFAIEQDIPLVFSLAIPFGEWAGRLDVLCDDEDINTIQELHRKHPTLTRDIYNDIGAQGCPAAKQILYVSEFGDVMPCPFLHVGFGNARHTAMRDIRARMLKVPELATFHPVCLAGENVPFIKEKLCDLDTDERYPVPAETRFAEVLGDVRGGGMAATNHGPIEKLDRECPLCRSRRNSYFASGREHEFSDTTDDLCIVVCCDQCGLVFLNPRPTDAELPRIYPRTYYCHVKPHQSAGLTGLLARGKRAMAEKIGFPARIRKLLASECFALSSPLRVLDIGCGNGGALEAFASACGSAMEGTGLDLSAQALQIVAAKGFGIINDSIEQVSLPPNHFDIVYSSNVIEHVGEPGIMLEKAYGALKPGGIFLCETPNVDSLDARLFSGNGHWGGFHFPRHWTFFTPRTFSLMAENFGFKVNSISYHPIPAFWTWSLHSYFMRQKGMPRVADKVFPLMEKDSPLFSLLWKAVFTGVDMAQKACTGKTSLMSIVLVKQGGD